MEIVFHYPSPTEVTKPATGDLLIGFGSSYATKPEGLAQRVLNGGLSTFMRGQGPIERIVVSPDPTLDDMLAAELARRLLLRQDLPKASRAFADYAYAVRRGYRADPEVVPLEASLEGVFQALRRSAGPDLSVPSSAATFLSRWELVAGRVLAAAQEGVDPTITPFRIEGSEFAQERDSLRRDQEVFRTDVRAGTEWTLAIPNETTAAHGFGLFLRDPKSKFFKYWSRQQQQHLQGQPYLLLAVKEGGNRWIFSSDPALELSLKGLHVQLQTAEVEVDSARAATDPWYDGARHQFTIVASPKSGTALDEKKVLHVVRHWARACVRNRKRVGTRVATCTAIAVLASSLLIWQLSRTSASKRPVLLNSTSQQGKVVEHVVPLYQDHQTIRTEHGKPTSTAFTPYNPSKSAQPVTLAVHISAGNAATMEQLADVAVDIAANGQSLEFNPSHRTVKNGEIVIDQLQSTFTPGRNSVIVAADAAGRGQTYTATLQWSFDTSRLPSLYVLAIGLSDYKVPEYRLRYASDDATSVAEAFARDEGLLFGKVKVRRLLNEEARRESIVSALFDLQEATQDDLVIVCVSGHGAKGNGDRFYLLPWEWDCQDIQQYNARLVTNAVSWEEDFLAPLGALPCQVLVVLDACHSGAAVGARGAETEEYKNAIQDAVQRKRRSAPGIVVLAACLPEQEAAENQQWGHGVCTLALLEALQGKTHPGIELTQPLPGRDVLSLQDVNAYVSARVRDLTGGRQAVVTKAFRAISLEDIPIALRPSPAPLSIATQRDESIR